MNTQKKILITPLNWGLGHATRCIPIIKALELNNFEPIIASDGIALALLKKEFPHLTCIELPAYNIEYATNGKNFKWKLLTQMPKMFRAIRKEKKAVQEIITTYKIEDNKGNTDLWLVPAMGGKAKQLTNTSFSESNARWRPDGKKIGFLSSESGESQLWEMNADGSEKVQISKIPGGVYNFNYSRNQKHIYFSQEIEIDLTVKKRYPDLPKANALEYDELTMRHWTQWEDGAYSHVLFCTVSAGSTCIP